MYELFLLLFSCELQTDAAGVNSAVISAPALIAISVLKDQVRRPVMKETCQTT